ncbi:MAG: hypothetical protein NTV86_04025 [Planctomycetota bacterium]|nr:hypothetical protein [Planctomycetota bacterium]
MFQKQRVNRRGKAFNRAASNPGMDLLEPRQLLSNTLLGINPQAPIIGYDNQGQLTYTAGTQALHVAGTPLNLQQVANGPVNFIYSNIGDLKIDIQVDNAGNLVGGVAGNDLTVVGDADLDGDYVPDVSGVLLTGEILQFGSLDTGTAVDKYDFLFVPTGGLLAGLYAGQDIGITMTSEHSSFVDTFRADFAGGAKGNLGAVQFGALPGIRIDKSGPVIAHAGQAITYTYAVVNPGPTPLSNVTVLDDNATPGNTADDFYATYTGGDANNNTQLDPGEVWTYSGTTTPTFSLAAPLVNTATARATWGNDVVTAQATYTLNPYLVNKSLYLYYGSTACKTYAVPYTVADTTAFTVQAYKGAVLVDTFTVSAGSPQGLWLSDGSYSFQEVNLPAGYVNVSSAVAYATGQGQTATGTFRNVVKYDLAVDKTGPETAAPGQTITYSYAVTNAGPASVVPTIKDDKTGTPTYVGGDTNGDHLLNPDETWLYQASYTVPTSSYSGGCGSWGWGSWGWGGCGSFLPQCGTPSGTSITNTVTVDEKSNPHASGVVGGDTNLANNTDTWTVKVSTAAAATGSLSGYVYVDKDKDGTRDCGEAGVPFVKLTLTGTDSAGNAVTKSTWTDCDGAYRFSALPAGKYAITETQPANYNQGTNRAGTLGGTVVGDSITNIVLPNGGKGVCYNFGELLRKTTCGGGSYDGGCGWDTGHDYNNKWCWDWNSDRSGCDWGRGWDVCGTGSYGYGGSWGGCF